MEKVMILGGRRGFGAAVANKWTERFPESQVIVTSRKEFQSPHRTLKVDLSQSLDVENLGNFIQDWKPQRIFCFAGGGPFGLFAAKSFKDHQWAIQVSFLSPAKLLHSYINACPRGQWIMTGSAIAEDQADPQASSYAASKHAVKGLISSIKAESPELDVRLFSPGYMNTDMLPINSAPQIQNRVLEPILVAEDFINWAVDPQASWHRVCRP